MGCEGRRLSGLRSGSNACIVGRGQQQASTWQQQAAHSRGTHCKHSCCTRSQPLTSTSASQAEPCPPCRPPGSCLCNGKDREGPEQGVDCNAGQQVE